MKHMVCLIVVGLLMGNPLAFAWHVRVNGVPMSPEDIQVLKAWNCGNEVPAGDYWFDSRTGEWGYAGGPLEGTLQCYPSAKTQRRYKEEEPRSPYFEDRIFEGSCALGQCLSIP